jgi:hypothetical protein
MIVYIVLILMGIFTVWNIVYTHNVNKRNNKMINNINNLDKKDGTTNRKG